MFVRIIACAALFGGVQRASADLVQLRDKASVSGKVLAEKRDAVVIDIGYTVLAIPKSAIVRVVKDADSEPKEARGKSAAKTTAAATTAGATTNSPLFRTSKTLAPERTVRELVAHIGEAVVTAISSPTSTSSKGRRRSPSRCTIRTGVRWSARSTNKYASSR